MQSEFLSTGDWISDPQRQSPTRIARIWRAFLVVEGIFSKTAVAWLGRQSDVLADPIQASWDSRRFVLTNPGAITGNQVLDEYPALVLQDSWLILGHSTLSSDTAYTFVDATGDIIGYKYPTGLLNDSKDVVFTNGGAVIYK